MVGLYDREGVLRFVGTNAEACLDYASLFEIQLTSGSLQNLPEPMAVRIRGARCPEVRSN